jgi:hypothetical protein
LKEDLMIAGLPGTGVISRGARPRVCGFSGTASIAALMLGACSGGDNGAQQQPPGPNPSRNRAPTINGAPHGTVLVGQWYSFAPLASDADGDTLTFSITGKPAWADFDKSTGQLSGTPNQGDVGTYLNIRVSVSDGAVAVNLPVFGIQVTAMATGSALLSWTAPTQNTDGSPLMRLDGYKIYWGTSPGNYTNSLSIGAGLASYTVEQLTPGTWYFAVTAVNAQGIESMLSNAVSKTI